MPKCLIRILTNPSQVATINTFIHAVAELGCSESYSPKQIELLNQHVFGIHDDDGAVQDETFFVVEDAGKIVATGGWSKRKMQADENPFLTPGKDPARIRTFFVDPTYRGLGTLLLQLCENAALEAGFTSAILYATLNGAKFYADHGYKFKESRGYGITAPPLNGETLEFLLMNKSTLSKHDLTPVLQKLAAKGLECALAVPIMTARPATSRAPRFGI